MSAKKPAIISKLETRFKSPGRFLRREESATETRPARVPKPVVIPTLTPKSDEELMKSLDPLYYDAESDPFSFEVGNLPDEWEDAKMDERIKELDRTLDLINQQLSDKIMQSYTLFVQGLSQVQTVGDDLDMTIIYCKNGRHKLSRAREAAERGLATLARTRKRAALMALLDHAESVRQMMKIDQKVYSLLETGDFVGAMKLVCEGREAAATLRHVDALKTITKNFQEHTDAIKQKIDASLTAVCTAFDALKYEQTLQGFQMIGKTFEVLAAVQRTFTTAVDSTANEVVQSYVFKSQEFQRNPEGVFRMSFKELGALVRGEDALPCLLQILNLFSDLMFNAFRMIQWHNVAADAKREALGKLHEGLMSFRRPLWESIQRKVTVFLSACDFAQFKVDDFLQVFHAVNMFMEIGEEFSSADSSHLRQGMRSHSKTYFEKYQKDSLDGIRVVLRNEPWINLGISGFTPRDMRELGLSRHLSLVSPPLPTAPPSFSAAASAIRSSISVPFSLSSAGVGGAGAIRPSASVGGDLNSADEGTVSPGTGSTATSVSSKSPLTSPHSLGSSVRSFLHTEDPSLNPFRAAALAGSFSLPHNAANAGGSSAGTSPASGAQQDGGSASPSKGGADDSDEEEEFTYTFEAEDEDHHGAFVPSVAPKPAKGTRSEMEEERVKGPVFANATFNVAKSFGKYMSMMAVLHNVAPDVFNGMAALFDFYLYTIVANFASPSKEPYMPERDASIPATLRAFLAQVVQSLAPSEATTAKGPAATAPAPSTTSVDPGTSGFLLRHLPILEYPPSGSPRGFVEKAVAAESLSFLISILNTIKPRLTALLPGRAQAAQVTTFLSQREDAVREIRTLVYKRAAILMLNLEPHLKNIDTTKWEVKEFASHSSYVDLIVRDLKGVAYILNGQKQVPQEVCDLVYKCAIQATIENLVDGYSRVKKCNQMGRNLMSYDLETLKTQVERMTPLRPIPGVEHAAAYIKAYFLSETELVDWVREQQSKYTPKQLLSLVNLISNASGSQLKKKTKQDLVHFIEELDKSGGLRTSIVSFSDPKPFS